LGVIAIHPENIIEVAIDDAIIAVAIFFLGFGIAVIVKDRRKRKRETLPS
jgi:hypothetical protein